MDKLKLELCTRKELMEIIRNFLSLEERETALDYVRDQRKEEKEKELSSWKMAEEYNRKKYEDLKTRMRNAHSSEIRMIHDDMVSALKAADYAEMRYKRILKELKEGDADHG